ncbi:MAG: nitroreductase family protein [Fusobacteriaceae bacterium]
MDFFSRRSIRKYKETKIEEKKISEILALATLAPSGKNKKPCEFLAVSHRETLKKLMEVKAKGIAMLEHASHGIIVLGKPEISDTWIEDCSIAATLIQLKAWELGIGSCWIQIRGREDILGNCSEKKTKELLSLPEELGVLCIISLGYPDETKPEYTEKDVENWRIHIEKY